MYLIMTTPESNLCSLCSLAFRSAEAYSSASFCEKKSMEKKVKNKNICNEKISQKYVPSIDFFFNFKLLGQL